MMRRTAQRYHAGTGMTKTTCEKKLRPALPPGPRFASARLCFSLRSVAGGILRPYVVPERVLSHPHPRAAPGPAGA